MKYTQLVKAIDSASQQLLGRAATIVNQALVLRNWLVGAYIVEFEQKGEDRAKYGERLLPRLADDLERRAVSGLGLSMLKSTRQFYLIYPQIGQALSGLLETKLAGGSIAQSLQTLMQRGSLRVEIGQPPVGLSKRGAPGRGIGQPAVGQLFSAPVRISAPVMANSAKINPLSPELVLQFSWTHILELIRIDDPLKRAFYENECLKGNWSKRQLQRQIGSLLYERTGLSKNKKAVTARANRQEPQQTIEDLIRDPYILEFTGLAERPEYHESDLEKALLDDLQAFLLELGAGFCFEARQFRVSAGNDHDYLDLVFYHRLLRCHVLLDLKIRPFKHADAGQMNYYLNYFKNRVMPPGDSPPVGIILCSDRDQTKVEFATAGMDNKLFVSRYLVNLPSPEQLSRFVESDRARIEAGMEQRSRGREIKHKLARRKSR